MIHCAVESVICSCGTVCVDHKTLSEDRERSFVYHQGTPIEVNIDFQRLRIETGALEG